MGGNAKKASPPRGAGGVYPIAFSQSEELRPRAHEKRVISRKALFDAGGHPAAWGATSKVIPTARSGRRLSDRLLAVRGTSTARPRKTGYIPESSFCRRRPSGGMGGNVKSHPRRAERAASFLTADPAAEGGKMGSGTARIFTRRATSGGRGRPPPKTFRRCTRRGPAGSRRPGSPRASRPWRRRGRHR